MEYKVVPFTAKISQNDTPVQVSSQLQSLISANSSEGWEYVALENVETQVAPDAGCFGLGIGAKPGYTTTFRVVVFRK